MIFKAKNGATIIEKINIDENKAIDKFANLNHALIIVKIEDDYLLGWHTWRNDWETFGGSMEKVSVNVLDANVKKNLELVILMWSTWGSYIIICRLVIG